MEIRLRTNCVLIAHSFPDKSGHAALYYFRFIKTADVFAKGLL